MFPRVLFSYSSLYNRIKVDICTCCPKIISTSATIFPLSFLKFKTNILTNLNLLILFSKVKKYGNWLLFFFWSFLHFLQAWFLIRYYCNDKTEADNSRTIKHFLVFHQENVHSNTYISLSHTTFRSWTSFSYKRRTFKIKATTTSEIRSL